MDSRQLTRRAIVQGGTAAAAALALPPALRAQTGMLTRPIPGTSENLSIVGYGDSALFKESAGSATDAQAKELIGVLIENGGSVIDLGPASHARVGQMLQALKLRDRIFLALRILAEGREAGIAQLEAARSAFGERPLDLVQVTNMQDLATQWKTLREWKDDGRIRYLGVSVSSYSFFEPLETFMRTERPDFVQLNYSLLEPRAEERLLPLAAEQGIAVITNRPFINGQYFSRVQGHPVPRWAADFDCTSWAQYGLKFILGHPAVTCAITETSRVSHARDNLRAGFGRLPDERTRQRMRTLIQNL